MYAGIYIFNVKYCNSINNSVKAPFNDPHCWCGFSFVDSTSNYNNKRKQFMYYKRDKDD